MPQENFAPAKVNLTLAITGRRADGYHTLSSLVVFADVGDRLRAAAAPTLTLAVTGPFAADCGDGADNLVMRAAQALRAHAGITTGAAITLEKNLPVGAGLGGGSADAAAALRLLMGLWSCALPAAEQLRIAVALGADVAVCLASRPALMEGIGERVTPLAAPAPPLHAVLVFPAAPLASGAVFAAYAAAEHASSTAVAIPAEAQNMYGPAYLSAAANDLEETAITCSPAVAQALAALRAAQPSPWLVRMSGSGSCCFALYADAAQAQAASGEITNRKPQWWVRATTLGAQESAPIF